MIKNQQEFLRRIEAAGAAFADRIEGGSMAYTGMNIPIRAEGAAIALSVYASSHVDEAPRETGGH